MSQYATIVRKLNMERIAMAEHPLNRHLFIADNLNLLRALDNESIDLICIDPPFAKHQTFMGSLRPPLRPHHKAMQMYGQAYVARSGVV
ncbi:MAG: hypothetical protein F4X34_00200 [Chloroflexi bacterium]|nr:hypothetical protein [Chloroflexota bacterium]